MQEKFRRDLEDASRKKCRLFVPGRASHRECKLSISWLLFCAAVALHVTAEAKRNFLKLFKVFLIVSLLSWQALGAAPAPSFVVHRLGSGGPVRAKWIPASAGITDRGELVLSAATSATRTSCAHRTNKGAQNLSGPVIDTVYE